MFHTDILTPYNSLNVIYMFQGGGTSCEEGDGGGGHPLPGGLDGENGRDGGATGSGGKGGLERYGSGVI